MKSIQCCAILLVIMFVNLTESALTLTGPGCGEKRCKINEFCSRSDSFCKPCADICDRKSHNYEEKDCVADCQGMLVEIEINNDSFIAWHYIPTLCYTIFYNHVILQRRVVVCILITGVGNYRNN